MNLKLLSKKIETVEEKLTRLKYRINLSHSSLASTTRKTWAKNKTMSDFLVKQLNDAISATAGLLKNNKCVPKDPVAWQKQIREEWN